MDDVLDDCCCAGDELEQFGGCLEVLPRHGILDEGALGFVEARHGSLGEVALHVDGDLDHVLDAVDAFHDDSLGFHGDVGSSLGWRSS